MGKPSTSAAVSASKVWGQPLTSSQPPRGAQVVWGSTAIFTFIVVACLARSGWLIIKWLIWLWLWKGRTSLALCDVLQCLAGAWQALGFLAGTRRERDSATFVPKVMLRELGLESTSVKVQCLQSGGNKGLNSLWCSPNKAALVQQDFAQQMQCGAGLGARAGQKG